MFFIRSVLKALEKPDKPFIHNVIPSSHGPVGKPVRCDRAHVLVSGELLCVMVEPDGIEPTTSCLQSTRSTN
jgi:hypothetical protein